MDQNTMNGEVSWTRRRYLGTAVLVLVICGALFLLAKTATEIKGYGSVGTRPENTIAVTGQGEVYTKPDAATFTFSIREEAPKVVDAQKKATDKTNAVVAALVKAGVNKEKDLKTIGYNIYPKYASEQRAICSPTYCPPYDGKQQIYAYEVSQTFEVKIHADKLETVGDLLTTVGGLGASDVSGLRFTLEDEEKERAKARKMAIDEAREKAEALASQLGVNLVRVVNFSENGGGYYPMYSKATDAYGRGGAVAEAMPAPNVPTGENKIESNVTIVYEIR